MKKISLTLIAFIIVSAFYSCEDNNGGSSDNNSTSEKLDSYFTIENSEFVDAAFPEATDSETAPQINNLSGNSSIIQGGANPISINSSASFSDVLIGIDELSSGYYKYAVPAKKSILETANEVIVNLIISTELPENQFTVNVALMNSEGEVGENQTIQVNTVEAGTGKLQVSLSWDLLNDIDLHVVEPDGNEIYYGNPGFGDGAYDWAAIYSEFLGITLEEGQDPYSVELTEEQIAILDTISYETLNDYIIDTIPGGNLDLDSNPGCSIDGVNNENITFPTAEDVQSGEYIVRVDFYSDCVGSDTTNYIVTARYDGELITPSSSTNPYYGEFEAGSDDYGDIGSGVEVMKFTIPAAKKSASAEKRYYFVFPDEKINQGTQKANARIILQNKNAKK